MTQEKNTHNLYKSVITIEHYHNQYRVDSFAKKWMNWYFEVPIMLIYYSQEHTFIKQIGFIMMQLIYDLVLPADMFLLWINND